MDAAQALIAIIGLVAAIVTYCLMRFPHMRRDEFRGFGAFSVAGAALGALCVFLFTLLLVLAQWGWQGG